MVGYLRAVVAAAKIDSVETVISFVASVIVVGSDGDYFLSAGLFPFVEVACLWIPALRNWIPVYLDLDSGVVAFVVVEVEVGAAGFVAVEVEIVVVEEEVVAVDGVVVEEAAVAAEEVVAVVASGPVVANVR